MAIETRNTSRKGLTLIELVMVLVILTALAALIIPSIDYIRRTSDKSTASFAMEQVMENIQLYRTTTGEYPNHFDSLMDSGTGTPFSALKDSGSYSVQTLAPSEVEGLTKIGMKHVMDHNLANAYRGNPGSSGVVDRDLDSAGDDLMVVTAATSQGQAIINSIYPPEDVRDSNGDGNTDVAPNGSIVVSDADEDLSTTDDQVTARLVVLGVGPANSAVGKTMVSAPAYQGVDALTQYNRFLAVFAVYQGPAKTKRAQLKAVLDSAGDFLNQELIEVAENNLE